MKIGSAEWPRVSSQHVVGEELVAPKRILNRRARKGNGFIFPYLEARFPATNGHVGTEADNPSRIVVSV